MNGPRRLIEQPGPSARLLRAAEVHVPSERARRRALLAAGSAAAAVAVSGSSAAVGGGVLFKSALVWLSAGMLGGAAMAVLATSGAPSQSPLERPSAAAVVPRPRAPSGRAVAPVVSSPSAEPAEPALAERKPIASPPGTRSALDELTPREVPTLPATRAVASAPALLAFAGDAPSNPSLYDELRLIDGARNAAGGRDARAVLSFLDRYDRAYPHGQFLPESLALRIETVARAGDRTQARALAARFRRDYPQHPLLGRVGAALGD